MYAFIFPERALTLNEQLLFFKFIPTQDTHIVVPLTSDNLPRTYRFFSIGVADEKDEEMRTRLLAVGVKLNNFMAVIGNAPAKHFSSAESFEAAEKRSALALWKGNSVLVQEQKRYFERARGAFDILLKTPLAGYSLPDRPALHLVGDKNVRTFVPKG